MSEFGLDYMKMVQKNHEYIFLKFRILFCGNTYVETFICPNRKTVYNTAWKRKF
jgi:hypothetical protein